MLTSGPFLAQAGFFTRLAKELFNLSKVRLILHSGGLSMSIAGFIVSLVTAAFLLIGLIPFLGWLNWITTLPAAVVGAVFSGIGLARYRGGLSVAGLTISIVVFVLGVARLIVGCGVI
jgi:hypothetical protein